jgi:hypothetical protein
VACEVGHTAVGHSFALTVLRCADWVADGDLAALGEWFGRQVGEVHAVHFPGLARRDRRAGNHCSSSR